MDKKSLLIGTLIIVIIVFAVIFFNNETPGGGNKNSGTTGGVTPAPPVKVTTTGELSQVRDIPGEEVESVGAMSSPVPNTGRRMPTRQAPVTIA